MLKAKRWCWRWWDGAKSKKMVLAMMDSVDHGMIILASPSTQESESIVMK